MGKQQLKYSPGVAKRRGRGGSAFKSESLVWISVHFSQLNVQPKLEGRLGSRITGSNTVDKHTASDHQAQL